MDDPMRLTTLSDYALRVLMYAAVSGDKLLTIEETARTYQISRAHLMKVVNILVRKGFLRGVRGRSGGFMLAKAPDAIVVGDVVRATEPDFALVECFATGNQCIVTGCCKLPAMLNEALNSFIATLDRYTIADLMLERSDFYAPTRARTFGTRGPTIRTAAEA
jgi:Rrf2 family transcriptional regulator, nitric oxide-sensitive transcriptional repressor